MSLLRIQNHGRSPGKMALRHISLANVKLLDHHLRAVLDTQIHQYSLSNEVTSIWRIVKIFRLCVQSPTLRGTGEINTCILPCQRQRHLGSNPSSHRLVLHTSFIPTYGIYECPLGDIGICFRYHKVLNNMQETLRDD